ncbi:MAG: Rrf2 family transcriptional regulator [Thermoleophilia bacterium]|nr:Rrf2 family transcriptional regulator [Thermoleophilia bacterium]
MIVVSDKSRAAVGALAELACRSGGPVPIQDIAETRGLALHVLEHLFVPLRRAGILQSQRGVKGGYSFRRPPASVTLRDVVEVVDGPLGQDLSATPSAVDEVWRDVAAALAERLSELTIADMVEREAQAQNAPMFHI